MSARIQKLNYPGRKEYYAYCEECEWRGDYYDLFDLAENKAVEHDSENHPEVF